MEQARKWSKQTQPLKMDVQEGRSSEDGGWQGLFGGWVPRLLLEVQAEKSTSPTLLSPVSAHLGSGIDEADPVLIDGN